MKCYCPLTHVAEMTTKSSWYFECPVCGTDVPRNAKACPECGACDRSGWKEDPEHTDGLDLPEEEFDYDEFVKEEFGEGKQTISPLWVAVAAILIIAFLLWALTNLA